MENHIFKYVMPIFLWVILLLNSQGCARRPALPDEKTIPLSHQLPIDGLWRFTGGKANSIFRIEKGRMYFFEKRKPLPKNSPLRTQATAKESKIRSVVDLSSRPGEIIAKDIKEVFQPLTYRCLSLSYAEQNHSYEYVYSEIKIVSDTQIVLTILPNALTGLSQKIEESFWRESLDNQTSFDQALLAAEKRGFPVNRDVLGKIEQQNFAKQNVRVPKDQSKTKANRKQKVLKVPLEKMESNGKLSQSAREFIEQAVQNAKEANGYVTINYPPSAPNSVIRSLTKIGVEADIDFNINTYELVITKP